MHLNFVFISVKGMHRIWEREREREREREVGILHRKNRKKMEKYSIKVRRPV